MPDVYLTPEELSQLIKFSKQSIYNLIHKKILIQGVHYFKPTRKKILFKVSAIKIWIEGSHEQNVDKIPTNVSTTKPESLSAIRINI